MSVMPEVSGCCNWADDGAIFHGGEVWENEVEATSQASKEDKLKVLYDTYYKKYEQDIMGSRRRST